MSSSLLFNPELLTYNSQAVDRVNVTVLEVSTLFVTRPQASVLVRPFHLDACVIHVRLVSMAWLPITPRDVFSASVQTKRRIVLVTQDGSYRRLQPAFLFSLTTPMLMDGLLITVFNLWKYI